MSTFPCPTLDEIAAASDAITKDGPGAEATGLLSLVCVLSPVIKEATTKKVDLLRSFTAAKPDYNNAPGVQQMVDEVAAAGLDANEILLTGAVCSLTVYGLNIGIRIGEARRQGMRSRQSVENLLKHVRTDCTEGSAAAIRVLQWVLGEREEV